ncbi:MAG: formyltransferase [Burkholderiaceae bacterium]|nr:formyltransferase [Burkholderiaceae bacterium]
MTRAVVFAYHQIGVRCLRTLLARGVDVALVVTHDDAPGETIWFDSVRAAAEERAIESIAPDDPNTDAVLARVRDARPDFLFSFYYRRLLDERLLDVAPRGGWNLHGSLLPKYRGRVPLNWAILQGETETGATLHAMTPKADAGAIVDQQAVPILPDDDAREVYAKICVAAEIVLWRSLPALLDGSAVLREQDPAAATRFGARRAEDGRIDPSLPARALHDLVRAVAKPFPGAFVDLPQGRLFVWRTAPAQPVHGPARVAREAAPAQPGEPSPAQDAGTPALAEMRVVAGELSLFGADGRRLRVLEAQLGDTALDAVRFRAVFGERLALPPLQARHDPTGASPR